MKPESDFDPELWQQVAPLTLEQRLELAEMFERWMRQLRASVRRRKSPSLVSPPLPIQDLRRN